MTKASPTRIRRKKARHDVAATALQLTTHGKEIEVGGTKYVALPASAYEVVVAALETLTR